MFNFFTFQPGQGGGDLARQEEDVQHLPARTLLLLRLHWLQHIVTNTGHGDDHDIENRMNVMIILRTMINH